MKERVVDSIGRRQEHERCKDQNNEPRQQFGSEVSLLIPGNDQIATTGNQMTQQNRQGTSQQIPDNINTLDATRHSTGSPEDANSSHKSKEKGRRWRLGR